MSNKVILMQQIRALIQLLEQGMSFRAIAAELRLSRQPVTLYAARLKSASCSLAELRQLPDAELAKIVYHAAPPDNLSDSQRRKDFNTRIDYFLTELKRTGVTRLLLWEEYRKECTDPYQYTQFCTLLKEASNTSKATMHLVHAPAAMMMVDFAGDKMNYVDRSTGEVISCPVLVVVLPFSKYTFVMALNKATTANIHDSEMLEELLDKKEDGGQRVYADSAYRSEALEEICRKKNIESNIHEKGYRNKPLTKRQKQRNKKKSKIRARVEHIFGFMTNTMNEMYLHYRNFVRNQAGIGLMNLTYNLFRLVQLKVALKK